HSTRPWGILHNPESFSMPSGHATLSTAFYLGIAFLVTHSFSSRPRWFIYLPAGIIIFLIGISRLYLGAHWFTDVISAWALSAALIMLIILSFDRKQEKAIRASSIMIITLFSLMLSYFFYYHYHITKLRINYSQIDWPQSHIP